MGGGKVPPSFHHRGHSRVVEEGSYGALSFLLNFSCENR